MAVNYRYLAVGPEATWGTAVSATKYIPVISADFRTSPSFDYAEDAANPYRQDGTLAKAYVIGEAKGYCGPEMGLPWLFKSLFGAVSSGASGSGYSHIFEDPIDHSPQGLTCRLGKEDNEFPFEGMLVTDIELSWTKPGYVMWDASFIGESEGASGALSTPSWSTKRYFHGNDLATIELDDASQVKVKAFSIKFSKSHTVDDWFAGTGTALEEQPRAERFTVSGSFTLSEEVAAWRTALKAGSTVKLEVSAVGEAIGGSASDTIEIILNSCKLTEPSGGINNRKRESIQYNFEAYYDVTNTRTAWVRIINAVASYADAS